MFSTDYPFEDVIEAAEFAESTSLDEVLRRKICHDNASRILRLGRFRSRPAPPIGAMRGEGGS